MKNENELDGFEKVATICIDILIMMNNEEWDSMYMSLDKIKDIIKEINISIDQNTKKIMKYMNDTANKIY